MILNLAVWFTLHVLFTDVGKGAIVPTLRLDSFSVQNAALVLLAGFIYPGLRVPMVSGLVVMALLAWGIDLLT